jgi:endonuclease-3
MRYKISVNEFTKELTKMFPDAKTELNYETEFQLLIAVMWSAQTTDIQVNKATDSLFKNIREPQDLINLGLPKIQKAIGTLGFFKTKAKHAIMTSEILLDKYN